MAIMQVYVNFNLNTSKDLKSIINTTFIWSEKYVADYAFYSVIASVMQSDWIHVFKLDFLCVPSP